MNWLKSWFSSPLGLIRVSLQLICAISCSYSNTASSACTWTDVIISIMDVIDGVASMIQSPPTLNGNPYCKQFDEENDLAAVTAAIT